MPSVDEYEDNDPIKGFVKKYDANDIAALDPLAAFGKKFFSR
jgi:hypothetical protein